MTVNTTKEKFSKVSVAEHCNPNKWALKQLQDGSRNFWCLGYPADQTVIRRLFDASCGLKKPQHRRRVNNEMRKDLFIYLPFFLIGSM